MKNVFQSWDRRGVSGAQNELPTEFCRFSALTGPAAAVVLIWQSHWWDGDFASLFESFCDLPMHARVNCSQYILHMCSGQSFVSCPGILPFTSFREMDLYFPAHWPGYYYKWEGNNIGWTAGSACNLLHICPFHGGLWARDSVHPSPLSRQQACLSLHHVSVSFRVFKSDIFLYKEYWWPQSFC